VNLWLNDIPANGSARVEVSAVRAIGRHEAVTRNAVVTFNGTEIPVPFDLKSTEVAELSGGYWTLIGDDGRPIARKIGPTSLKTRPGINSLSWRGEAGLDYPRAEVTLISLGAGEPAFRKGAVDSKHLAFEPERPLVYRPSAGLDAVETVRTRPGETAQLELRIVGPVVNPIVSVGNVVCAFPCTLGTNDVLRCTNGKDWRVTRVARCSREVVAEGRLQREIAPFTGAKEIRVSSKCDAEADARVSVAKRYRR
jgi:hypothetical protein